MSVFLAVLRTHQWLYEHSGGLVGHRLLGTPTLLLRTIGRRTGLPRTSALVYAREGDAYLVVASNGGAPRGPGWLANLTMHPECEIQVGTRRIPVTARPIRPDDPSYERRWRIVNEINKGRYTEYQAKTGRIIPLVELLPR
ncbi:nitroreductase family deazaflavin-dependent oxidoreductase [Pseudonocardiaceae bacterium YIM PH 21723]|nr:nitroreductase family deazaflavin-dependent oxidoreductase [Pseudonocardiaceae bacterium YIM PH 21723]